MPVETLDLAEPFFGVRVVRGEDRLKISGRAILVNLGADAIGICGQSLRPLQSVIVQDVTVERVDWAVIIERFDDHDDDAALFDRVQATWPSAFDMRGEERLRGVAHYMSKKVFVDNIGITFYHSGSVPLNVGLHKEHPFCPVPGFREVHTQVVGFGKMQQCHEQDVATLYLEEPMAPGATHRPMYDAEGNYPWHQYETITPSIFVAFEILPEGVFVPGMEDGQ